MGQWNITIRGCGSHHNVNYAPDANRMAAEFVDKLKLAGHQVTHASITHGSEDDLTDPTAYLEARDKYEADVQKMNDEKEAVGRLVESSK